MYKLVLIGLMIELMGWMGCAASRGVRPTPVPFHPQPVSSYDMKPYRIEVGDVLDVKLFYNPDLNETVTVRPDGRISLPLLDEIQAAGLTPAELDHVLTAQYGQVLKNPEVTVIVRTFSAQKVYVGGEVKRPGLISVDGPMTLLQVLFQAGGVEDTAEPRNILVIRRGPKGERETITVDWEEALSGRDPYIRPYDVIYVPKSTIARVDLFVEQYINRLTPVAVMRGFEYLLYWR